VGQNNSEAPDADFCRYLASVTERDVDLLLMEEFHVSDDFVAWFCGELGLHCVSPAGAWHSLSDTDGESDLLLRVLKEGRRIGILIENKVTAPEQDDTRVESCRRRPPRENDHLCQEPRPRSVHCGEVRHELPARRS